MKISPLHFGLQLLPFRVLVHLLLRWACARRGPVWIGFCR